MCRAGEVSSAPPVISRRPSTVLSRSATVLAAVLRSVRSLEKMFMVKPPLWSMVPMLMVDTVATSKSTSPLKGARTFRMSLVASMLL